MFLKKWTRNIKWTIFYQYVPKKDKQYFIYCEFVAKNTPIKTWCVEQIKTKQSNQAGDKIIQTKINSKR